MGFALHIAPAQLFEICCRIFTNWEFWWQYHIRNSNEAFSTWKRITYILCPSISENKLMYLTFFSTFCWWAVQWINKQWMQFYEGHLYFIVSILSVLLSVLVSLPFVITVAHRFISWMFSLSDLSRLINVTCGKENRFCK